MALVYPLNFRSEETLLAKQESLLVTLKGEAFELVKNTSHLFLFSHMHTLLSQSHVSSSAYARQTC